MMRWTKTARVLFGTGACLVTATIFGCPAMAPQPGENEVLMRSIAFDPVEITISVGESVTWRNMDIVPHTATSGAPGDADAGSVFRAPDTGLLAGGQSASVTFDEAGEFVYFCEVHPGTMRDARVIVQP